MFLEALRNLDILQLSVLLGALALALSFEVVNGFHDTANAVATVIYTRSLRPIPAVIWSGLCNMAGIFFGGIGVAFTILHLLPMESLVHINTGLGLCMVLSLILAAIVWNLGTWYLGILASSSHALIGSLVGVAIIDSVFSGRGVAAGVNTHKLLEVGGSLLLSPLLGFVLSAVMFLFMKNRKGAEILSAAADPTRRPPWWVRAILVGTSTGVSFAHGSNDGQKGMGLIMLILIGVAPTYFALNLSSPQGCDKVAEAARALDETLVAHQFTGQTGFVRTAVVPANVPAASAYLRELATSLSGKGSFTELSADARWAMREKILRADASLKAWEKEGRLSGEEAKLFSANRKQLVSSVEYVPFWVVVAVALALGLGTMVGWKRVVVTVGEKIGKSHLTYGQGASAELIAMTTIGFADFAGMPVSTTHVLSSGVAGTMWAGRSGVNLTTMRNIALAWIFTLPACMLLSATLMLLFFLFLPATTPTGLALMAH